MSYLDEYEGQGEPAPACPECREPLDEDGGCWYCETKACDECGDVKPAKLLLTSGICRDCWQCEEATS
jgi:hypothetical protein